MTIKDLKVNNFYKCTKGHLIYITKMKREGFSGITLVEKEGRWVYSHGEWVQRISGFNTGIHLYSWYGSKEDYPELLI